MSNFMVDLWESIFTPGPTPTLLIATNATFGALQLLLLALLLVTHSIHFIILSFLCGGLWWSINWFARELARSKANDETGTQNKRQTSPDPTGSDTETEAEPGVAVSGGTATGAEPGGGGTQGITERRPPPPPQPGAVAMPPPTSKPIPRPANPQPPVTSSSPEQSTTQESNSQDSSQGGGVSLSPLPPRSRDPSEGRRSAAGGRRLSLGESSGYVSTDSEWEKVSEGDGK